MAYVHKIRFKNSAGCVPKGYEMQIVTNTASKPGWNEVKKKLIEEGFDEKRLIYNYSGAYDDVK